MTREEKNQVIEELTETFSSTANFYFADTSELSVAEVNNLRALCHKRGIKMMVAKNTLIRKALDASTVELNGLDPALKGPTALFLSPEVGNAPAKVIKEFRKKHEKPVLKAAYIDTAVFVGEENLDYLSELKSKDEMIAEVISLLQSPAKNVVSSLQSGGNTLSNLLKALEDRAA